jgi:hypothetical protein
MPVNTWQQLLNSARRALVYESRRSNARRRRLSVSLRLEELESRVTPSVTFLTMPGAGVAGQPLNPAVQVSVIGSEGSFNFPVSNDLVTLAKNSGPGGFTPSSPLTATTDQTGVATFNNLVLDAAGSYTFVASVVPALSFTSGTSAPSSSVTIDPGPASQLVIASSSQIPEGTPLSFTVTAVDPFGNPATGSTIHFSSSTTEASLPPDYTFQTSDNGQHTFDVAFTVPGTQTVTATVLSSNASSNVSATDSVAVQPVPPGTIQLSLGTPVIAADQPVTLAGTFTDPGTLDANTVVIAWGDGSANTMLVLPAQVRSFSAVHTYTTEGDYFPTVFITNADGGTGAGASEVQVLPGPINAVADARGQPGQTTVSSVTDAQFDSISITLSLSPADLDGSEVLVAKLADAALPSTTDRAGLLDIFDIRETGAEIGDSALVTFRFRAGLDFGQTPVLRFLDPTTGTLQLFVPSGRAGSFVLTRQGDFIVGRVLLDNTSTPTLLQLTRTVFTISVSVPGAAATAAVSASVASADPAATAPVSTATFRTTSQLTLTLEPTQASQVSAGLSSFNTTNSDGGGEPTHDDAAAALVSFLMEEADAALRAWGRIHPRAIPPQSAAPGSADPGSPTVQKEDESLRDASEYLFRELASTLTLPLNDAAKAAEPPARVRSAGRHASAPQSVVSTTKTGRAAFLAGLAVAIPERRKKRERKIV